MVKELVIYVSAGPEMDPECELLGQLLADMTKSIRWTIKRTPGPYQGVNPDLELLQASQFYLVLLGMDVYAPIGVELATSLELGLYRMAYRNRQVTASPAAAYFAQNVDVHWQPYSTPQVFIQAFEKEFVTELITGTPGYGLDLADLEELTRRLRALGEDEGAAEKDETLRGAGRGGVILSSD